MNVGKLAVILSLVLMPLKALAASWYVSPTGSDSLGSGSRALPLKTLTRAFAMGVGGDTYILMDGLYNYTGSDFGKSIRGGLPGAYTIIKAENDGGAIVTTGIDLANTVSYVQVEGLRFHDNMGRKILGHHLKFLRNEFKGGCSSGNCVNTSVGSNDYNDTADILFEDNWFHGLGGRYNLLVYNADRVVVRRAVVRHDGGWTDTKGDPEAGINFYASANCSAQNVIVIDSDLTYSSWAAAFYGVKNSSVLHASSNNSWLGVMAIRTAGVGLSLDDAGPISFSTIKDSVFWDNKDGGITLGTGSRPNTSIKNVTIGRSKLGNTGWGGGIGYWGSHIPFISAVIIKGRVKALDSVSATNYDCFGNSECKDGTGKVIYDPETNGLKYLGRIESGSPLGTIGANVVNRIGSHGSLQGEAGWNTDTGTPLWPWPLEARIKKEMCADVNVSRGFCGDPSLTNYVWNYLGRGNPYGAAPLPTPIPPPPPPPPQETVKDMIGKIRVELDKIDQRTGGL